MHLRSTVTALAAVSLAFSSPFSRPSGDAVNSDGVLIEGAQSAGSAMAKSAPALAIKAAIANLTHTSPADVDSPESGVSNLTNTSPADVVRLMQPLVDCIGDELTNSTNASPAGLAENARPYIDALEDAFEHSNTTTDIPQDTVRTVAKAMASNNTAHNDYSCRSESHPYPVVLIHGLMANYKNDIGQLEQYLKNESFCTYSTTYGAISEKDNPMIGAIVPVNESAPELAAFINDVHQKTGAEKVDLVGHSEGAFMSLYVPKFTDVSSIINQVIAIAPPTHGTTFAGIYKLSYILGKFSNKLVNNVLGGLGCKACVDLVVDGPGVEALTTGPIAQPGINYTILASQHDEIITPVWKPFVNETGVQNFYVQDFCPEDKVGHVSEPYDANVQFLVASTLSGKTEGPANCVKGKRI